MSDNTRKWDDLTTRIATAVVLVVVGIVSIGIGGQVFVALASIAAAVMVWELMRMFSPQQSRAALIAAVCAVIWGFLFYQPSIVMCVVSILVAPLVGVALLTSNRLNYFFYALAIVLACFTLSAVREHMGVAVLAWIICVVAASDIAGYFAGRMFGGPKFWPAVSPKKTWTGTIAGWIGALTVGIIFAIFEGWGPVVVLLSGLMALAAQMGDIAESAIKRHVGVKDASAILPGHGGVMDRFDALIGASVFFLVIVGPIELLWHIF